MANNRFSLPKMKLETIPDFKYYINVGAGLDVPTGEWVKGTRGESILNGGVGMINAIVGKGNTFKSVILHYMTLSAASKIYACVGTYISTYDSESNISPSRLVKFSKQFKPFKEMNIISSGVWDITDKTICMGNTWFEKKKEFLAEKVKNISKYKVKIPIADFEGNPLEVIIPTFAQLDSITEFQTSQDGDMQDDNELGDAGANRMYMQSGAAKTRMLSDLPRLLGPSGEFAFITAHVQRKIEMAVGPMAPPPERKLQALKNGDSIKGAGSNFTFLTNSCWQTVSASPFLNKDTKAPEYPLDENDVFAGNTDLQSVLLRQLRNKSGPTGVELEIIVSQREGVLPTITEFHFIKSFGRFGLEGNNSTYNHIFVPDVKISRNTIRQKTKEYPELARAINISSEILQTKFYMHQVFVGKVIDQKFIYETLKAKGYDWKILLNTRGYSLPIVEGYEHEQEFLSSMDIVNMCLPINHPDFYVPYWYDRSNLTLEKEADPALYTE